MKTFLFLKAHVKALIMAGSFFTILAVAPISIYHNTPSPSPARETQADNAPFELRINSGGSEMTFGNEVFKKDNYYGGNGKNFSNNTIKDIANTDRDALYRTERSTLSGKSTFNYAIPVPDGKYIVKLHFAEIYWGAQGGEAARPADRVFDVNIEDKKVLDDLNIYGEVGSMAALVKTFTVTVTDGKMNLDFSASADQPKLSALEISQIEEINDKGVYINAGGGAVNVGSKTFSADKFYKKGRKFSNTKIKDIKNTTADALYTSERSTGVNKGKFSYQIPVKDGQYEVKLHFAELWWGATGGANPGINRRKFSVNLEGRRIIKNLDLVKEYGSMTAVVKTYKVTVNDGTLNIDFSASKDQPKVSAIEVIPVSGKELPLMTRINTGGPAMKLNGLNFEEDAYFSSGSRANKVNLPDIKNTETDRAYMSERSADKDFGSFSYNFPISNGEYEVKLHFAEIWFGIPGGGEAGTGKRIFDVDIENSKVIDNLDLTKEVGGQTALIKSFTAHVEDGELNIDFTASVDRPTISAIEIYGNGKIGVEADPCRWNYLASSSIKKTESMSATVNNKFYTLAGFTNGLKILGTTEIYDPANDVWTKGAPMPVPVTHMGVTVVDDDIWVVAGFTGNDPGVATDKVQIYNTTTNTWRSGPPIPAPRGSGAAVYNEGKIHFFGGLLPDRMTNVDEHYVFDPKNPSKGWKSAAKLPHARCQLGGASIDGIVYAIGGQYGHDNVEPDDQKWLEAYDPDTDTWTRKADLPSDRSHFEPGTLVHNGKIIIIGGRRGWFYFFNDITEYDPATNTWTERCKLPNRNMAPNAMVYKDRLIIANGGIDGERHPTNETKWIPIEPERKGNNAVAKSAERPQENTASDLKLYPNPSQGNITLQFDGVKTRGKVKLAVKNMTGLQMLKKEVMAGAGENTFKLATADLRRGIYFVEVTRASGVKEVVRFVKM